MKLHGYFRSSASYRVRIALNLKGLSAEHLPHHLRKGEQRDPAYLAINPQGLVPTLEDDGGAVLTQSLAIIEWLDETHPEPPLLPKDPLRRAKVRAFAMALACDTHPVQNLKVLARLRAAWSARGTGDGLGGLGQPRGSRGLRNPDRGRARSVLLRRGADPGRSLPGAATRQCAALRRRCRRLSAPAEGRGGREKSSRRSPTPRRSGSPMPSKSAADHDGCGLHRAGLSVSPDAADRGRDFRRGVQGSRPDAGAICRPGRDPHPSRHRCDAALRRDRLRSLDARQRDRAAGGQGNTSSASHRARTSGSNCCI